MVTEEAASALQEAADAFLDNIKKTIKKEICLNRFLMQMKVPYSWKKIPQWTFIIRKSSEPQDLEQERIF